MSHVPGDFPWPKAIRDPLDEFVYFGAEFLDDRVCGDLPVFVKVVAKRGQCRRLALVGRSFLVLLQKEGQQFGYPIAVGLVGRCVAVPALFPVIVSDDVRHAMIGTIVHCTPPFEGSLSSSETTRSNSSTNGLGPAFRRTFTTAR